MRLPTIHSLLAVLAGGASFGIGLLCILLLFIGLRVWVGL